MKGGRGAVAEAFADPKTSEVRRSLNEPGRGGLATERQVRSETFQVLEIQKKWPPSRSRLRGQSMLDDRLRADYERSVRDEADLRNELEVAKGEAVQQNQASIQYSVLQQDLETAKALYTDFLNKTSQADIQRAEQFNNVRLIESAETPGRSGRTAAKRSCSLSSSASAWA